MDLRGREAQRPRQVFSLGRGQVALPAEAALQLVRLRLGEQHAPLAPRPAASAVLRSRRQSRPRRDAAAVRCGQTQLSAPTATRVSLEWDLEAVSYSY